MYDMITVGSATVDAFAQTRSDSVGVHHHQLHYPSGAKILIDELIFTTGGGGTNTAVAFSRLGLKTAYLGKIGLGHNSERVIKELSREKVDTSLIHRGKGRTGYSVILDARGEDRTILAFKGGNNDLREEDIRLSRLNTRWFYFSAMMGKAFKAQLKIAKHAERKGIKIAYNPSSYLAMKGKGYLKPILSRTHVLVLNKEEAEALLGLKKAQISSLAKGLLKQGPGIVVITDGSRGAHASDGKRLYSIKPRKSKIVETTGAGDAFASGFTTGIIRNKHIGTCLKMGMAEAESVITHHGAKNRLLKYGELMRKVKQMPKVVSIAV